MDPDRSTRSGPATPPDEATLAAAVRDVVEAWHLPPQRLDTVTWRDRVDGRSAGRRPAGWRWTRRFVAATSGALVATVALAVAAVWLSTPRAPSIGAASPTPTISPSGATPRPTAVPSAPRLPAYQVFGRLPSVTNLLVQDGSGFRVADLKTGDTSTPVFPIHDYPITVVARPSGGWVCFCADFVTRTVADPAEFIITLEPTDASGARLASVPLRTLDGQLDPLASPVDQPQAADARVTVTPDGTQALVGWSVRATAEQWKVGIDIVDLDTLKIVRTIDIPSSVPTTVEGVSWARVAPSIAISVTGDWYVSSDWYAWTPASTVPSGTDHWVIAAGEDFGVTTAGTNDSNRCAETGAGWVDATTVYVTCWSEDTPIVERRDLQGTVLATSTMEGQVGREGAGTVELRTPTAFYSWDPVDRRIDRYDIATGVLTTGEAPEPVATIGEDWLATFGRRLGEAIAPSAAAKVMLQPGLVLSPDGTRLYGLGLVTDFGTLGSSGVFVFDATTLEPLDHWAPNADLTTMAISADGTSLYVVGGAGRDAQGIGSTAAASITVYDTSDGSIRLIDGDIGPDDVWFPVDTLR